MEKMCMELEMRVNRGRGKSGRAAAAFRSLRNSREMERGEESENQRTAREHVRGPHRHGQLCWPDGCRLRRRYSSTACPQSFGEKLSKAKLAGDRRSG
jgi:hypothetical protein